MSPLTRRARLFQARPWLEALEDRFLLSGNVLQTNLVSELTQIALKFGGGGGDPNTLYFTAGLDNEQHGLFGSLTAVAPGTPEGPAEAQKVVAAVDVFQIDLRQLVQDLFSGASQATIRPDIQTVTTDFTALVRAEQAFAADSVADTQSTQHHGAPDSAQGLQQTLDAVCADLGGQTRGRG